MTEVLKSSLSVKNTVDAISKIVSQFEWPPKDKKVFWTKTYEELISKNKSNDEITIPESEYKRLHTLLERYFATKDFSIISRFSRTLKMICSALDSHLLYEPPLTDQLNLPKLNFLLNDILKNSNFCSTVAIPLLEVNLRNKNGIEILKKYLLHIFQTQKKSENLNLRKIAENINLYLDKKILLQNLKNAKGETFKDALVKIGVLEKFCITKNFYFTSEFSLWIVYRIMSHQRLSLNFINKNLKQIKLCTSDEEKIIQAFFITKLYEQKYQNAYEEIQLLLDLMQMKNADSEFYWQVNNKNLQEKFKDKLEDAFKIVRTMITTDFISYVFNYLGSNVENDERRIRFWRKYAGSIIDFKIFYSHSQKSRFQNSVLRNKTSKAKIYADIINEHSLLDNEYSKNTSDIALIFKFEKLIIVEFPKTGKPIQIYQPTNTISKLFDSKRTYANFDDIRQYKDIDGERLSEYGKTEGSFAHRGYWEITLPQYLQRYWIYTDKGGRI